MSLPSGEEIHLLGRGIISVVSLKMLSPGGDEEFRHAHHSAPALLHFSKMYCDDSNEYIHVAKNHSRTLSVYVPGVGMKFLNNLDRRSCDEIGNVSLEARNCLKGRVLFLLHVVECFCIDLKCFHESSETIEIF